MTADHKMSGSPESSKQPTSPKSVFLGEVCMRRLRFAPPEWLLPVVLLGLAPPAAGQDGALKEGQPQYHGFGDVHPGDCEIPLELTGDDKWARQLWIDDVLASKARGSKDGKVLRLEAPIRPQQKLQLSVTNGKGIRRLDSYVIDELVSEWPEYPPCQATSQDDRPPVAASIDLGYLVNTFAGVQSPAEDPESKGPLGIPATPSVQPMAAPSMSFRLLRLKRVGIEALWIDVETVFGTAAVNCDDSASEDCSSLTATSGAVQTRITRARSLEFSAGPRIEFATFGQPSFLLRPFVGLVFNRTMFLGSDLKARNHNRMPIGGVRVISGKLRDSRVELGWASNELITRDNEECLCRLWWATNTSYAPSSLPAKLGFLRNVFPPTRLYFRMESDFDTGRDWVRASFGLNMDFGVIAR